MTRGIIVMKNSRVTGLEQREKGQASRGRGRGLPTDFRTYHLGTEGRPKKNTKVSDHKKKKD